MHVFAILTKKLSHKLQFQFSPLILLSLILISFYKINTVYAKDYVDGELIIKMKSNPLSPGSKKFFGKMNQKGFSLKSSLGKMQMHVVKIPEGQDLNAALKDIEQDPEILYAEPNFILHKVDETPSKIEPLSYDQMLSTVASYSNGTYTQSRLDTGVTEAWSEMSTNSSELPVVAVIDTGIDYNHTVLKAAEAIWNNPNEIPDNGIDDDDNGFVDDYQGWNFYANHRHPWDDEGHGTHVSGIVVGTSFDIFETPVAKSKIKVMPLKFLGADGSGDTSSAIKAIDYAINNGAKIINASWGGSTYSRALHDALTRAYSKGIFIVTAAGNSSSDNDVSPIYPASLSIPGLVAVAASNSSDQLAFFSNFGVQSVHLAAPGVSISSFYPRNLYGYSSGTSMASPFIAGVGALLLRESPNLSGYQLKEIILNSVKTSVEYSQKIYTSGRVDVLAALRAAKNLTTAQSVIPSYTASVPDRALASDSSEESGDSGSSGKNAGGGCGTIQAVRSLVKGNGNGGNSPGPDVLPILVLLMLPLVLWALLRTNSSRPVESARSEFDKRFATRLSVSDSILVKTKQGQFTAQLKNISRGGLAFTFNGKRVDVDEAVSFVFTSKDGKEQIEVSARIIWTDDKSIAGVQFHQLNNYIQGFFLRSYVL